MSRFDDAGTWRPLAVAWAAGAVAEQPHQEVAAQRRAARPQVRRHAVVENLHRPEDCRPAPGKNFRADRLMIDHQRNDTLAHLQRAATSQPCPDLALPSPPSPDAKTYTFTRRKGSNLRQRRPGHRQRRA